MLLSDSSIKKLASTVGGGCGSHSSQPMWTCHLWCCGLLEREFVFNKTDNENEIFLHRVTSHSVTECSLVFDSYSPLSWKQNVHIATWNHLKSEPGAIETQIDTDPLQWINTSLKTEFISGVQFFFFFKVKLAYYWITNTQSE